METKRYRAQGCLLGQLAGDAQGSLVEFQSPDEIRRSFPDGVRELADGGTWSGGKLIHVNPKNTSRTCLSCGHISAENRKTQTLFLCTECGYSANADYVAAVNIKARGIEKLKTAGHAVSSLWRNGISRPVKQEPVGTSDLLPLLNLA